MLDYARPGSVTDQALRDLAASPITPAEVEALYREEDLPSTILAGLPYGRPASRLRRSALRSLEVLDLAARLFPLLALLTVAAACEIAAPAMFLFR